MAIRSVANVCQKTIQGGKAVVKEYGVCVDAVVMIVLGAVTSHCVTYPPRNPQGCDLAFYKFVTGVIGTAATVLFFRVTDRIRLV